jgi:hypothetical protein
MLGCQQTSNFPAPQAARNASWSPVLTSEEISLIRQTIPPFEPELFPQGAPASNGEPLTPENFSPAVFWGYARPRGMRTSPRGIMIETNGYDGADLPDSLGPDVTYVDRNHQKYQVTLGLVDLNPLHNLERRMGGSLSLNPPPLVVDQRIPRASIGEVENIILSVQSAVSIRLPEVASVDPRTCEVVIEPTIFYVSQSNHGSTWAGGLTETIGSNRYRLHVEFFYINSQRAFADWRQFLVHESINCFVLAVGRSDLVD